MDRPDPIPPTPPVAPLAAPMLDYATAPAPATRARAAALVAMAFCLPALSIPFLRWPLRGMWVPLLYVFAFACPLVASAVAVLARRSFVGRRHPVRVLATLALALGCTELAFSLVAAVLLPSSGRPRESAQRIKCVSNLRQIGQGLLMYSNDFKGQLPPSLDVLLAYGDVDSRVFICPSSNDDEARGPTTAQVVQAFRANPRHCSYVYLYSPNPVGTLTPAYVLAHEPLANHDGAGMNVLYADGSADWMDAAPARRLLAELQSGHNPPRAKAPED